jgi:hypothetical protein
MDAQVGDIGNRFPADADEVRPPEDEEGVGPGILLEAPAYPEEVIAAVAVDVADDRGPAAVGVAPEVDEKSSDGTLSGIRHVEDLLRFLARKVAGPEGCDEEKLIDPFVACRQNAAFWGAFDIDPSPRSRP